MCGYVGFVNKNLVNKEPIIKKMMDRIIHRGPDSEGFYTDENVALGFRRLSIIGLEDGMQPIYNEDKSLVLLFNGEIYNYKELKEDLIAKGHSFYTHSDSEVLIHLYEEEGEEMLPKLRGMFSFTIYSKDKGSLFMARDYFGIKPLYYGTFGESFIFGSEIKSFLDYPEFKKELNLDALESYLSFQYSSLQETFFKNIFKLTPGHYLKYKDGAIQIARYFTATFEEDKESSLDEIVDDIEEVFKDSVKAHKISDVEVGSFLSSGIDSSYAASVFQGDKTFTVGFAYDKYNEIEYARELSKIIGIKNESKVISDEEYWGSLGEVQYHMDEPLADPSAVALYFVSQVASKQVKVVLSGEGADELFGGYTIYKEPISLAAYSRLPFKFRECVGNLAGSLPDVKGKSFLQRAGRRLEERYIGNANIFSNQERKNLLKVKTNAPDTMEVTRPFFDLGKSYDESTKMQLVDINTWLIGDILLKADKMSMAHSLELRVPFLDKEVFKVARTVPLKFKVNNRNTKYALRLAARRDIPRESADRPKLGFPVPIRVWLREKKYYDLIKGYFAKPIATELFNNDALLELLDDHFYGKKDNSRKIWTVYIFLLWYEVFFEKELGV
ncbi:MAG: asparagine synthase (glutamine-hydrolyzing) [Fusobacteria bacterium]|nr:asparagine synthase (glutamine-hydrolyzing) [Fusobacteriota bacterium]